MSVTNNGTPGANAAAERNRGWIVGAFLIVIGILSLVGQFAKDGWLALLFLPALALTFLIWGAVSREAGFVIPAGILGGVSLGTILERATPGLTGQETGAVFVLALAAGFAVITPLTAIVAGRAHWWALLVAGILGLVGGALLAGGVAMEALKVAGQAWPLILIGLGVYIIFKRRESAESGDGGRN
jgi:hypothetical protein